MGVESYMHRFAKQTLAGWLRDACFASDSVKIGPFSWRVNRPGPSFGVWEEYPVCADRMGLSVVWDEYPLRADGCCFNTAPPTRDDLIDLYAPPAVIFDVAIQHKGQIIYAIEVVHKNDLSDEKLSRIRDLRDGQMLHVYKVPARWILSQVDVPQHWSAVERIL